MKKLVLLVGVALGAAVLFKATSGSAPETAADLPGATFAASVPIYPGATYVDRTGGEHSDSARQRFRYETWMLKFQDPRDRVVAFYDGKYPNAERDAGGGDVQYTVDPDGTGKRVEIRVFEGELEITEFRAL